MASREKALTILGDVYRACSEVYSISDAFLYGSYARGDNDEESDVDILLTVDADFKEIEANSDTLAHIESEISLQNDITVSIAVKPYKQFAAFSGISPYYRNVINEGIRYAV